MSVTRDTNNSRNTIPVWLVIVVAVIAAAILAIVVVLVIQKSTAQSGDTQSEESADSSDTTTTDEYSAAVNIASTQLFAQFGEAYQSSGLDSALAVYQTVIDSLTDQATQGQLYYQRAFSLHYWCGEACATQILSDIYQFYNLTNSTQSQNAICMYEELYPTADNNQSLCSTILPSSSSDTDPLEADE